MLRVTKLTSPSVSEQAWGGLPGVTAESEILAGKSPSFFPRPHGEPQNVHSDETWFLAFPGFTSETRFHPKNFLVLSCSNSESCWRGDAGPISGQENPKREMEREGKAGRKWGASNTRSASRL